jgi:deoxyxylulose-5-phosphate synthase
VPILHLGLPDEFIDHGDPALLLANCRLDAKGLAASILARFGSRRSDALAQPAEVVKIAKPAA